VSGDGIDQDDLISATRGLGVPCRRCRSARTRRKYRGGAAALRQISPEPGAVILVIILTDEHCTGYSRAGHPERPHGSPPPWSLLKQQKDLELSWRTPSKAGASDEQILRAHTPGMLARLDMAEDFDGDTPFFEGIGTLRGHRLAQELDALKLAREGKSVFSLMRPPGHHATRAQSHGFCYLNNIAITALEAAATGAKRVAVV